LNRFTQTNINLLLIRHAQGGTEPLSDKFLGNALSKLGERQADCLAERLANMPFKRIYSSDMARSYQTAAIIKKRHSKVPWVVTREIREIGCSLLPEQKTDRTKIGRANAKFDIARAEAFVEHLYKTYNQGELVCIVAHGGFNRVLMARLCGMMPRNTLRVSQCHTSITGFGIAHNDYPQLYFQNYIHHLPNSMVSSYNLVGQ